MLRLERGLSTRQSTLCVKAGDGVFYYARGGKPARDRPL